MNTRFALLLVCILALQTAAAADKAKTVSLFDGKSFKGWSGDTEKTWRIVDGAIVGGTLDTKVPRNEFLKTTRPYTNFVLHVKFKLLGKEGFVNGGVQIRSEVAKDPPNEMVGYQCDIGEGWWGALYDESRRRKPLVKPDEAAVEKAMKRGDWNQYEIRCEGKHIQSKINGVDMIDYTEPDDAIPQQGLIGLQVHGNGVTEAWYKDVTIEELP